MTRLLTEFRELEYEDAKYLLRVGDFTVAKDEQGDETREWSTDHNTRVGCNALKMWADSPARVIEAAELIMPPGIFIPFASDDAGNQAVIRRWSFDQKAGEWVGSDSHTLFLESRSAEHEAKTALAALCHFDLDTLALSVSKDENGVVKVRASGELDLGNAKVSTASVDLVKSNRLLVDAQKQLDGFLSDIEGITSSDVTMTRDGLTLGATKAARVSDGESVGRAGIPVRVQLTLVNGVAIEATGDSMATVGKELATLAIAAGVSVPDNNAVKYPSRWLSSARATGKFPTKWVRSGSITDLEASG